MSEEFMWGFGGYKLEDGTVVKVKRNQNHGHVYALRRDPSKDYSYRRYGRNHKSYGWSLAPGTGLLSTVIRQIEEGKALWRNPSTLNWEAPVVRRHSLTNHSV